MKRTHVLLTTAVLLSFAGVASAQEAAVTGAPAVAKPYPLRRLDRPRTLPAGAFGAEVRFGADHKLDTLSNTVIGAYVPVVDVEARLAYSYALKPSSDFRGVMTLTGRYYAVKAPPHLFLAAHVDLPISLVEGTDALSKVVLGAPAKYKFNQMFAVYFGDALLSFAWAPDTAVSLNLPVSLGAQLNDNVMLELWTNLGKVNLSPSEGTKLISDATPLELRAWYSPSNKIDTGLAVGSGDLQADTKVWTLTAVVGYRGL